MSWLWPLLKWAIGLALALYVVALALLYVFQRDFYYPAPGGGKARAVAPGPGWGDVTIDTMDGLALRSFYRPARGGLPTVVFFHGNGDGLNGGIDATEGLVAKGYGLLLPEYRGYGGNAGSPDEQGLYRDGLASIDWLERRGLAPSEIVAIGNSLGSGIATEVTLRKKLVGLVLVSGFASLTDVVAGHYPIVPRSLVRDRYDNVAKIGAIKAPILLYHGGADRVVPLANAQALHRAQPKATLIIEAGAGHELAYSPIASNRIAAWMGSHVAGAR